MPHGRVQKFVNGEKSPAGENEFDAHEFVALFHVPQQFDFLLGSGSEVSVPAFGASHDKVVAIPERETLRPNLCPLQSRPGWIVERACRD